MQEEQIFFFPTNKFSNKIRRDLGRYSTLFSEDFNPSGKEQLLFLAFFDSIFYDFCRIFNNAALLLFLRQPLLHRNSRHKYRLQSCLKRFLHLYSFISHKYFVLAVGGISYGGYFNLFSGTKRL